MKRTKEQIKNSIIQSINRGIDYQRTQEPKYRVHFDKPEERDSVQMELIPSALSTNKKERLVVIRELTQRANRLDRLLVETWKSSYHDSELLTESLYATKLLKKAKKEYYALYKERL